jgi:hypothetical protein
MTDTRWMDGKMRSAGRCQQAGGINTLIDIDNQ